MPELTASRLSLGQLWRWSAPLVRLLLLLLLLLKLPL